MTISAQSLSLSLLNYDLPFLFRPTTSRATIIATMKKTPKTRRIVRISGGLRTHGCLCHCY